MALRSMASVPTGTGHVPESGCTVLMRNESNDGTTNSSSGNHSPWPTSMRAESVDATSAAATFGTRLTAVRRSGVRFPDIASCADAGFEPM